MNTGFGLKKPCNECPILKHTKQYLSNMLGGIEDVGQVKDIDFFCHKTYGFHNIKRTSAIDLHQDPKIKRCAGFMILREKLNNRTTIMENSIAAEYYNPKELELNTKICSIDELLLKNWFNKEYKEIQKPYEQKRNNKDWIKNHGIRKREKNFQTL